MPHILVIDDDPLVRELLEELLLHANFHVTTARHGAEGLRLLATLPVDLVITDIVMTELDGLSVLRAIRGTHPHLPVLVISGGSTTFDVDHLLELAHIMKASAWMKKPFNNDQLISTITQLLADNSPHDP